jgi:hypothetical protein
LPLEFNRGEVAIVAMVADRVVKLVFQKVLLESPIF